MGAGQSSGIDVGGSTMGYQVLRVYPNSPGSRAGLKAYFDFIVAIGNNRFNRENSSLREILKASVDQKLQMVVYNTKSKKIRETEIVPSTNWGGNGLLGVSIKHSSFDRADERVWHVVEVEPGSPAQQAGLQAKDDYVIGSDSILQENDDLYNLVEAHDGKALKLFVYNTKTDNCREVICHPNSRWGGKGLLGCEFGHGLLHRIPCPDDEGEDQNVRASSLRSEQKVGSIIPPVSMPSQSSNFNQNQVMQQFQQRPGHQLLQQALSDRAPQQQQPTSIDNILPPPPAAPQTFAQLATAQYQSQQYQQSPAPQVQTPPQLPPRLPPQLPPPSQLQVPQTTATHSSATPQLSPSGATYPHEPSASITSIPQSQSQNVAHPSNSIPDQSDQFNNQSRMMQQELSHHQLLQQAPSDHLPHQQQPTPMDDILAPPPPVPQTFAQLATAQFQNQQYQPPPAQHNPHQSSPTATNGHLSDPANSASSPSPQLLQQNEGVASVV